MQTAITFGAEVVGCFVPQGAMGSDAVVLRLHQRALLRASATDSNSSQFKNSSRSRLWKDSMKPFSQGLAGATGIAFVPVCGNQAVKIAQMNSEPLSLRIRVGPPRRA